VSAEPRRIRLDLAYDGTGFAGWQLQPGVRTVQGDLEAALSRLQGERPVRIRGAGRTDAGVHARAQVADCEIETELDDDDIGYALRRILPVDLRPCRVRTVSKDFHARNSARSKTYAYHLDVSAAGDPFRARYALHQPRPLDRDALEEALNRLPGRRDWSGFVGTLNGLRNTVRELTAVSVSTPSDSELVLRFTADGFLYHMVRNLVGTLLEVGLGRREPDHVLHVLARRDRTLGGPTAAPHGLFLESVLYDEDLCGGADDRE